MIISGKGLVIRMGLPVQFLLDNPGLPYKPSWNHTISSKNEIHDNILLVIPSR